MTGNADGKGVGEWLFGKLWNGKREWMRWEGSRCSRNRPVGKGEEGGMRKEVQRDEGEGGRRGGLGALVRETHTRRSRDGRCLQTGQARGGRRQARGGWLMAGWCEV